MGCKNSRGMSNILDRKSCNSQTVPALPFIFRYWFEGQGATTLLSNKSSCNRKPPPPDSMLLLKILSQHWFVAGCACHNIIVQKIREKTGELKTSRLVLNARASSKCHSYPVHRNVSTLSMNFWLPKFIGKGRE